MPFAFPIQQVPRLELLSQTEIVFNEKDIQNSLLKDNGATYDYVLNKHYKNINENSQDIYMRRKLNELLSLINQESAYSSSITQILENKNFKAIVDFGPKIIPLILEELKHNASCLVWAMNLITGRKISDNKISLSEAAKLWVAWGKSNQLIK
jgi:hypothetical protein